MKKIVFASLLIMLPLKAVDFFFAYGAKAGPTSSGYIISNSVKGSLITFLGAFGIGRDVGSIKTVSPFTTFSSYDFTTEFDYVHYDLMIDYLFLNILLGYDLGYGRALTTTTSQTYLQMEASADLFIPIGEQFALNLGFSYPWVFTTTVPTGMALTDISQYKISLGIRLISYK